MSRCNTSRFIPVSLVAPLVALSAPAWSAIGSDATPPALDEVLVTASRTDQGPPTLAASTVIDREDIDRLQPRSVVDVLRGQPGINFSNTGGPGKNTTVFMRGTEGRHLLVLVDGVRIGSATSGGASWQDIPVEQIERIEIVRGPFSSLYGSEALGGVVQIFTRRPAGNSVNASVGVGSEATRRGTLGIGGRSVGDASVSGGWYAAQLAHERTEGISVLQQGRSGHDPDLDGYRNSSISLRGGWRFNPRWLLEANALHAKGFNEYDGSSVNESDVRQQVFGGKLVFDPHARLRLTASAGHNADLSDNLMNGTYVSAFNTRRDNATVQADAGVGDGLLTVGWDWTHERVGGSTDYARDQRYNRALFGQWQHAFGAHALQASLRRDADSQFGGSTTGSAIWGWDISDALRATASYGTAFRAPTFNQLYFPDYGNPDLGPETSRSVELGLRGVHAWGGWSLSAFRTQLQDMIVHDSSLGQFGGPNNIDRALITGLEAGIDTSVANWDVRLSANWLNPRNDADGANHGNLLPRRARRSGRIDVDRAFGTFDIGATLSGYGTRYDNPANTQRLGGYGLLDLRAGWRLDPAWSLALALNNVADKQYETARYYNQPGRNWLLTLRYSR